MMAWREDAALLATKRPEERSADSFFLVFLPWLPVVKGIFPTLGRPFAAVTDRIF